MQENWRPSKLVRDFLAGEDQRQAKGYRPDIDGLRAIAIMSVMLFHLDFVILRGGFVGVDIFFVISGYLIGKSILDQRRVGSFTLTCFYQKRLKRIIPALVAMLLVTTFAALFMLLPVAMIKYGQSLISAVYSLSNILFWLETGYFDTEAHAKPLLHTWSLGVEEQFYILFPISMLLIRPARGYDLWLIAGLALASLAASIAIAERYPSANFFLIPTRAWEMLLGVLAAEWRFRFLERRLVRELLGIVALATLGGAFLLYRSSMTFPGLAALPPVIATAVLLSIGAHGASLISRLLALKPAAWMGLISYSLYLWHWPIIVLIKQWMPEAWLRMPERVFALGLTFSLAWISWRFVERPFRSHALDNRVIWWFSGLAALFLSVTGAVIIMMKGFPQRYPDQVVRYETHLDQSREEGSNPCQLPLHARPGTFVPSHCLRRASGRPNVLIIGDSHGNHLRHGLEQRFPDIAFQQATAAGCRMTITGARNETSACAAFRTELFNNRLTDNPPDWVVIGLFWGDEPFGSLKSTIEFLRQRDIKVIVAGPVTRYEVPLPHALAIAELRGDPRVVDRVRIPGASEVDAKFARFARENEVEYMSTYKAMCPREECILTLANSEPIQIDSHHLGEQGSLLVARSFPVDAVRRSQLSNRTD